MLVFSTAGHFKSFAIFTSSSAGSQPSAASFSLKSVVDRFGVPRCRPPVFGKPDGLPPLPPCCALMTAPLLDLSQLCGDRHGRFHGFDSATQTSSPIDRYLWLGRNCQPRNGWGPKEDFGCDSATTIWNLWA